MVKDTKARSALFSAHGAGENRVYQRLLNSRALGTEHSDVVSKQRIHSRLHMSVCLR